MTNRPQCLAAALLSVLSVLSVLSAVAPAAAEQSLDLFEKRIRPIFVDSCGDCHGTEKQKGGLRLDSKAGWTRGGESGPAVVPGKPDDSLLITEQHGLLGTLLWNDTVRYLRHHHDRFIEGNAKGRTWFYE